MENTTGNPPRPLGRPCRVCSLSSQEREAVESEIVSGVPFRTISDRHQIARTSLRHHLAHHLTVDDHQSQALGLDPVTVALRIHDVAERARDAASEALDGGDAKGVLRAGDAELRALSALRALGVNDEGQLLDADAYRAVANAAGRAARADPAIARAVADQLDRVDRRALAAQIQELPRETQT